MWRTDRIMQWAGACIVAVIGASGTRAADAARPTVVELFTSQGCSSCPPANENLAALAGRPDVLALSFGVTYWDQLGWKDTFAQQAFTARQWDYAHRLGHSQVWTPQMLFNGRADVTGASRAEIDGALRKADRGGGGPQLSLHGRRISVGGGAAPAGGADIWLVRYDPRVVQVPIRRGENTGRTLPHRNVVREMTLVGHWKGQPLEANAPAEREQGLASAVLVQAGRGGAIIAAARG